MAVKLKWNKSVPKLAKEAIGIDTPKNTPKYVAVTWHKLYYNFIPYENGDLANEVEYSSRGNVGTITHNMPYSHYQYEGDLTHTTDKHPLASKEWDKAAIAAGKGEQLTEAVQKYIKR